MQRLYIGIILALAVGVTNSLEAVASSKYQSSLISRRAEIILAEANIVGEGKFRAVEHPTQGKVNIIEKDGVRYLELSDNFLTDEGPDLKVILHTADTVELKVQEGDYISLGALEAFAGSQKYAIPEDVDLSKYQSVAIWCEQFNATFGYAPLGVSSNQ